MQKITQTWIASLSDEGVYALTMENPDTPGERVFAFALRDFESRTEMAACMALLITRLKTIQQRSTNQG